MKLSELPATALLEMLRATERAQNPDSYAVRVLREELDRRLRIAEQRETRSCNR